MSTDLGQRSRRVRARYRASDGAVVDTTLERLTADEVVGGLPVREFRWRKGQRHYSGWYWSSTVERLVAYESRLELARIMLADFDTDVIAIVAQPFQLVGADGARIRRHVPDLLLVDANGGATVIDVKAPERKEDPEVQALFAWTRETVSTKGWGFEAWYGADARLLANVRFLAGYRNRRLVDGELVPAVRDAAGEGTRIVDLERVLDAPGVLVRPAVLHLLWRGELVADLTGRTLDGMTIVRLGPGVGTAA